MSRRRFRSPSRHSNGNTFDFEGRQIAFCHYPREVIRYEHDGQRDRARRQPTRMAAGLNAPNDGMVHPDDGSIWFTDPGYGALMDYEGERVPEAADEPAAFHQGGDLPDRCAVRGDQKGRGRALRSRTACASAHDYTQLYVADTGASHYPEAEAGRSGSTTSTVTQPASTRAPSPRRNSTVSTGFADGHALPTRTAMSGPAMGWVGDGYDGVHVFAPDGDTHRPDPPARDMRQHQLRRQQAQPVLHGGEPPRSMPCPCRDARRPHHLTLGHCGWRGRLAPRLGSDLAAVAQRTCCNSSSTSVGTSWAAGPMRHSAKAERIADGSRLTSIVCARPVSRTISTNPAAG
jgi:sugar lactone lactonase YvrE